MRPCSTCGKDQCGGRFAEIQRVIGQRRDHAGRIRRKEKAAFGVVNNDCYSLQICARHSANS